MFKHLLVPTDGSALSRHAAMAAVELAKMSGARITGIHVAAAYKPTAREDQHAAPAHLSPDEYAARAEQTAQQHLDAVQALAEAAGVSFEGQYVLSDFPAEAIVKAAERYGCDTIVIGSRRQLGASAMGSVAQKVLVDARIPVLVT